MQGQILYKYRNWKDESHKNLLLKNQLFISPPIHFNDPFDCRIPENFSLLDSEEKIKEYVHGLIVKNFSALIARGRDIKKDMENLELRLKNNPDEIQKQNEDNLFEMQDHHYGILSLSEIWNSILMWSHYSDNHKGYCAGFWEEKLKASQKFGKGGLVNYDPKEDFPLIDPRFNDSIDVAFIQTHNKASEWSYEKEYRLTKTFYPQIPTEEDRTVVVSSDYIAEIIIGLNTPKKDKEEIIDIAKQKGIKVLQVFKEPFKFKLGRKVIL